jgi:hypothetical protein
VSPSATKEDDYWEAVDNPDARKHLCLNSKYMQTLREKYSKMDLAMQHEYFHKLSHLIGKPKNPQAILDVLMQDEIDQVKDFQYQFITSDTHTECNVLNELNPGSGVSAKSSGADISSKSELYFQGE